MDDSGGVRRVERGRDLFEHHDGFVGREAPAPPQFRAQRPPFDVLEHEERDAAARAHVVDDYGVGMAEAARGHAFAPEPAEGMRVSRARGP